MVVWVVKIPMEEYKIRSIFGLKSTFSEEIIVFFNKHVAGFLKRENNMTYCNLLGTISI